MRRRYYIVIYACDDCGMEHEQPDLAWDEETDTNHCPDCGSRALIKRRVWSDAETAGSPLGSMLAEDRRWQDQELGRED